MDAKYEKLGDIDIQATFSRKEVDKLVIEALNVTICNLDTIIDSHKKRASDFEEILLSMRETHENVGNLIARNVEKPQAVDAVSLARQQIEWVFLSALLIEDPSKWWDIYRKDAWQKQYKMHLFKKEELGHLEGFDVYHSQILPDYLEQWRVELGISNQQIENIKNGKNYLEHFPSPSDILKRKRINDNTLYAILERIYKEYEELSDISHPTFFSLLDRCALREKIIVLTPENKKHIFEKRVVENSLIPSYIGILIVSTEFALLLSSSEPRIKCGDAWEFFQKSSLLGKRLFGLRYKEKLGMI